MSVLVLIGGGFILSFSFTIYLATCHSQTLDSLKKIKVKLSNSKERMQAYENRIKSLEARLKILEFHSELFDDNIPTPKPEFSDEVTTPSIQSKSTLDQWEIVRLEDEITSIKKMLTKIL